MAKKSAISWLKLAVAWVSFHCVRLCERLFPPSVLSLLLWPPSVVWDLVHPPLRNLSDCWRRFPESWKPRPWRFFLRQRLGLSHSELLYFFPDRLSSSQWLSRCRLEGGADLIEAREGDRGVVLVSVHFGPSEILPYWLRAHGIGTTLIGASPVPESLERLADYQSTLKTATDGPAFLSASEMSPLPRFAHVGQFLGPGRRLLVMVDVNRGIQFQVPFENRSFRMATGAIRLAAMADAELIPCLITETPSWKFVIHFGSPVPRGHLGRSPDMLAIGRHLLGEFSKIIRRYPEQCNSTLLSALSPLAGNGIPGSSAAAHPAEGR